MFVVMSQSQPCRFGRNCLRANCPYMHATDRQMGGRQQFDPTPELRQQVAYTPRVMYSHAVNNRLPSPVPPPNIMMQRPQPVPKVSHPGYAPNLMSGPMVMQARMPQPAGPRYVQQMRSAPPQMRPGFALYDAQNNMHIPVTATRGNVRGPVPISHGNMRGGVPISHGNMGVPVRVPHGNMGVPLRRNLGGPVAVPHGNLGGPVSMMSRDSMNSAAPISRGIMSNPVQLSRVPMGNPNPLPIPHVNIDRPSQVSVSPGIVGGPHPGLPGSERPGSDDTWKDEWFSGSRNCTCCEGYIYRCKEQKVMCHSGSCSCSTEIVIDSLNLNSMSLNDENPLPISSPTNYLPPSSYQPLPSPSSYSPLVASSPYPSQSITTASPTATILPQYQQHPQLPQHPQQLRQPHQPNQTQMYRPLPQQYSQLQQYSQNAQYARN